MVFTKLKNLDDDTKVIDSVTKKSLSKLSEISDNFMSDYDRLVAKMDEVKTSVELATNKKQGFKSILDTLEERLFKVDTIRDCLDLKSYCLILKKRFSRYLTVEDGEHRLKYEAGNHYIECGTECYTDCLYPGNRRRIPFFQAACNFGAARRRLCHVL